MTSLSCIQRGPQLGVGVDMDSGWQEGVGEGSGLIVAGQGEPELQPELAWG